MDRDNFSFLLDEGRAHRRAIGSDEVDLFGSTGVFGEGCGEEQDKRDRQGDPETAVHGQFPFGMTKLAA
jgi:hypothetical protein